jgi:ABC-2 type transport system ATP-binding protein
MESTNSALSTAPARRATHQPSRELAIEVTGLRKSFGDHVVLDGIDLQVPAGTVLALLGPNGAGKTTVVRILSTLIAPDGGEVRVAGHDLARDPVGLRASIGVTGQFAAIDDLLTGEENLRLMSDLHHLPRGEGRGRSRDLLERFDLVEASSQRPSTYSGGMRRRLDLAMGLMGRPRVLFLDEPTTGLDPRSRRAMWDIVRELVASGVTILLTTQYLEEADQLADTIVVLDQGHIVAQGTAEELKRRVPGGHVRLTFATAEALEHARRSLPAATADEDALALSVPHGGDVADLRSLLGQLDADAIDVEGFTMHTPDLDDVFLALTGEPATQTEERETVR